MYNVLIIWALASLNYSMAMTFLLLGTYGFARIAKVGSRRVGNIVLGRYTDRAAAVSSLDRI
jgi:hypothetical protein